jgi:hypothetical protein
MPYSKFTNIEDIAQKFQLTLKSTLLFPKKKVIQPSTWLLETLEKAQKMRYLNEKERSERLANPILTEICDKNDYNITLYSGRELTADRQRGLHGECDFMLSFGRFIEFVDVPLFTVVEAKRNDLEYGTAQCAAQMVGMQLFNQQKGANMNTIFGATTNGREWKFMQLIQNTLCIDEEIFEITDHRLSFLLGALQTIIEKCKNN